MSVDFKNLYKSYWGIRNRGDGQQGLRYYLETVQDPNSESHGESRSLLALEMAHAECRLEHSQLPRHDPDKRVTLVYLVGTAYEPLFQSIWAHRPDKLIPVVNQYYGSRLPKPEKPGGKCWAKLANGIGKLPPERIGSLVIDPADITEDDLVEDSPTAVFDYLHRKLRDDLRDPQCEIVIDITGAKKTMVAGAFMFAAYTNARIYYIDADYYEGERPYGYSCRFRKIESPLDKLSLAIWRQIEEQYRADNFLGALQLLETILGDDGKPESSLRQLESVQQFRKLLSIISAWDRGQLDEAHQLLQDRQPQLAERLQPYIPTAVAVLPPYWNQPTISEAFFRNQQAIILHAHDELARIDRLERKKQYRSAFTRAYALCETLLKSRVVALFVTGRLAAHLSPHQQESVLLRLLQKTQTYPLCNILTSGQYTFNSIRLKWETPDQPGYLPDFLNLHGDHNANLREFRNFITHDYVAAEPRLTAEVIQLAADNLADYETNWGNLLPVDKPTKEMLDQARYAPPSWEEIRRDCRLDFIPDLNVQEGS